MQNLHSRFRYGEYVDKGIWSPENRVLVWVDRLGENK